MLQLPSFAKLAENSFRDVNIAFANELSLICDKLGIDPTSLSNLANRHPRVNILSHGIGVGGHCIAVDPWFIASRLPNDTPLIQTARAVNKSKTSWVIDKVLTKLKYFELKNGRKPKIAVLGLAYKPNVGDLRESPALEIVQAITSQGFDVLCVEPHLENAEGVVLVNLKFAMENADFGVALVNHRQFRNLNDKAPRSFKIIDFCNLLMG